MKETTRGRLRDRLLRESFLAEEFKRIDTLAAKRNFVLLRAPEEDADSPKIINIVVENGVAVVKNDANRSVSRLAAVRFSGQQTPIIEPLRIEEIDGKKELVLPVARNAKPKIAFYLSSDAEPSSDGTVRAGVFRFVTPIAGLHVPSAQLLIGDETREMTYILNGARKEDEEAVAQKVDLFDKYHFNPLATRGISQLVTMYHDSSGVVRHDNNVEDGYEMILNYYQIIPHDLPSLPDVRSIDASFPIRVIGE